LSKIAVTLKYEVKSICDANKILYIYNRIDKRKFLKASKTNPAINARFDC